MKNLYSIFFATLLFVCSCNKENSPEPEIPTYDPKTQAYINGLIWDKYPTMHFCLFDDAKANADVTGKRIPEYSELAEVWSKGYTFDNDLGGCWFGEDSEKLSNSEKSIFLKAAGFSTNNVEIEREGKSGGYWCYYEGEPRHSILFDMNSYTGDLFIGPRSYRFSSVLYVQADTD